MNESPINNKDNEKTAQFKIDAFYSDENSPKKQDNNEQTKIVDLNSENNYDDKKRDYIDEIIREINENKEKEIKEHEQELQVLELINKNIKKDNDTEHQEKKEKRSRTKVNNRKKILKYITTIVSLILVIAIAVCFYSLKFKSIFNEYLSEKYNSFMAINSNNDNSQKNNSNQQTLDDTLYPSFEELYDGCNDSCVGVSVYGYNNLTYSFFESGDENKQIKIGEGSGVIYSTSQDEKSFYVITCAHVINGGTSFNVTLNDNTVLDAKPIGFDTKTDLAVLLIKNKNNTSISNLKFANSDNVKIGSRCIAIGCPGGINFMNSLSDGIVSNLDIPIKSEIGYNIKCIQTTAAINPGNSGGGLFNLNGELIGINSSKIASVDYEGMSFAIPSNTVKKVVDDIIKNGYVTGRASLGISYDYISNFSNYFYLISKGVPNGAIVVTGFNDKSDLEDKNIAKYDVITAVDNTQLNELDSYETLLESKHPGDEVVISLKRFSDMNNSVENIEIKCKLIEAKNNN